MQCVDELIKDESQIVLRFDLKFSEADRNVLNLTETKDLQE